MGCVWVWWGRYPRSGSCYYGLVWLDWVSCGIDSGYGDVNGFVMGKAKVGEGMMAVGGRGLWVSSDNFDHIGTIRTLIDKDTDIDRLNEESIFINLRDGGRNVPVVLSRWSKRAIWSIWSKTSKKYWPFWPFLTIFRPHSSNDSFAWRPIATNEDFIPQQISLNSV